MKTRRDVFQAIADPTRRAILVLLTTQALPAGVIAQNFDSARPTISKHLQILTECELVTPEQDGRTINYHLNANKLEEIAAFIAPFAKFWDQKFNQLEVIMKLHQAKK